MCIQWHILIENMLKSALNIGLTLRALLENTIYGNETYKLSGKVTIRLHQLLLVILTVFGDMKEHIATDFHEKKKKL